MRRGKRGVVRVWRWGQRRWVGSVHPSASRGTHTIAVSDAGTISSARAFLDEAGQDSYPRAVADTLTVCITCANAGCWPLSFPNTFTERGAVTIA